MCWARLPAGPRHLSPGLPDRMIRGALDSTDNLDMEDRGEFGYTHARNLANAPGTERVPTAGKDNNSELPLLSAADALGGVKPAMRPVDNAAIWPPALIQRFRVLLHALPLFQARLNDPLRDPEHRHYDSMALAMKVIDLVIENTGLGSEINRDGVIAALRPILQAIDTATGMPPESRRHEAVADRILGALRNDADRRAPFDVEYQDFDEDGRAVRRKFSFRLVLDRYDVAGNVVLGLSPQAINMYLNALELDIEDAQAANEAVVASQLARGKFNEAIQSARNARLQSVLYHDKIRRIVQLTRRDVQKVDWHQTVPHLLKEALEHISVRLTTEANILQSADERLDNLPSGDEQARSLVDVIDLIKDCRQRHLDLQNQLMQTRPDFLDQQARQAFSPLDDSQQIELLSRVLEPLLGMPERDVQEILLGSFPAFVGAQAPPVFSLGSLVSWQLRPKRAEAVGDVPLVEQDLTDYGLDLSRFPPELQHRAQAFLAGLSGDTTLSAILDSARESGFDHRLQELLVLKVLHRYAADDGEAKDFRVDRIDRVALSTCGFFGNELKVSARGAYGPAS